MDELEGALTRGENATDHDGLLIRRLCEGDSVAYGELCERFGPRIYRFAVARLSGDAQLAEDVMIQTLVDAARRIRRFDPRKSTLSTWLHGMARREIYRELRKRHRQKTVPASAEVPLSDLADVGDGHDIAASSAARLDAQRRLSDVVRVLSRTELDVLAMAHVAELSAGEIGRIMGRSERAVHSILHRARQKVRERLVCDDD